jgi:hypothetical protein
VCVRLTDSVFLTSRSLSMDDDAATIADIAISDPSRSSCGGEGKLSGVSARREQRTNGWVVVEDVEVVVLAPSQNEL